MAQVKIRGLERQAFSYHIDTYEHKTLITNCCWICEGWIELEFVYPDSKPLLLDIPESEPVFLLLKHEDYQLVYMPVSDDKRKVSIMVPKMKIFFCFFVNDQLVSHSSLPLVNLTMEENIVII